MGLLAANLGRLKLANIIKKPKPILPPPDFPLLGGGVGVSLEAALLAADDAALELAAELATELVVPPAGKFPWVRLS